MLRVNFAAVFRSQVSARALHTSAPVFAAKPVKAVAQGFKKGGDGKKNRKSSGSHKFYESFVSTGKYSNKAPELELPTLSSESKANEVVKYSDLQYKRLVHVGAFKKDQFHELFSKPITLVRDETIELRDFIEKANTSSSKENRICFIGESGIGKSTLLAQSQALISQDSIILPISYAFRLVDGSNDFWYDPQLKTYTQPMYLKKFFSKIEYANESVLSKIKLSKEYSIENAVKGRQPIKFTTSNNLLQVVKTKLSPRQRGIAFELLLDELSIQKEFPVFLTVDNFGSLPAAPLTKYRNVENKPIYIEELQITKKIFELTSGEKSFNKGGIILSTSSDDLPSLTLDAGLGLVEADPYAKSLKFNTKLSSKLTGVKALKVDKLSKENVSSLVEKLIEAKVFRVDELNSNTKENLTNQKYILSGNGNPLELLKSVTMFY